MRTNECRISKAPFRFNERKSSPQTMGAVLSHIRVCSVIVCVMFCLETRLDRVPLFACAVRITSMILRTVGFLCVLYTHIFALTRPLPKGLTTGQSSQLRAVMFSWQIKRHHFLGETVVAFVAQPDDQVSSSSGNVQLDGTS